MKEAPELTAEEIEEHKKKVGLDENISDLYERPVRVIEEELDPVLVKILSIAEKMFREK